MVPRLTTLFCHGRISISLKYVLNLSLIVLASIAGFMPPRYLISNMVSVHLDVSSLARPAIAGPDKTGQPRADYHPLRGDDLEREDAVSVLQIWTNDRFNTSTFIKQ